MITAAELRAFGVGKETLGRWVREGRLFRVHRGVFAVGRSSLSFEGRALAAVLACGPRAVASHRTGAALADLLPAPAFIDVTVPRTGATRRDGIRTHSSITLTAEDVTHRHGIPCTTTARTLIDIADTEPRHIAKRAFDQSEVLRLFDRRELEGALKRAGPRHGAAVIRNLTTDPEPPTLTETEIEDVLIAVVENADLPPPEVQAWLLLDDGEPALRPDLLWRKHNLIAEADGGAAHRTRRAFEDDRRRDQRLASAGYTVVRFTWRQLTEEPGRVAASLRTLLARLAPP